MCLMTLTQLTLKKLSLVETLPMVRWYGIIRLNPVAQVRMTDMLSTTMKKRSGILET